MTARPPPTPPCDVALVTLHAGYHHSSLALRAIAAFCREEPFFPGLTIHEGLVKASSDTLFAQLVAAAPRLVGFSTYLWNVQPILRLARNLRQLLPQTRIVLGGPEAGPRGEELLAAEPWLDFVIDGEGEPGFRDLARWCLYRDGEPGRIAGLVWRDAHGTIRRNPPQPLPPAQWVSPYTWGLGALDKPLIYWETSRGCPYRCTFCTSSSDRLRTASPAQIDADLAVFRGLANKTIKLLDRSFHLGTERTLQLLERFLDTPESLRFHLELNPDRVSDEALALFAEAPPGKFQFEIGLQTLSEPVLARIERVMDVGRGLERIRALVAPRRHPVHLDLIVGLPGENAEACRARSIRSSRCTPITCSWASSSCCRGRRCASRPRASAIAGMPNPLTRSCATIASPTPSWCASSTTRSCWSGCGTMRWRAPRWPGWWSGISPAG